MEETLAAKPFVVFHPVHISSVNATSNAQRVSNWKNAMNSVRSRYEWFAKKHRVSFVRCDHSYPAGGSSFVVTPDTTTLSPTMHEVTLPAIIPSVSTSSTITTLRLDESAMEERTHKYDNAGSRITRVWLESHKDKRE